MAKGDDLEERLIEFAVRIIRLCEMKPTAVVGRRLSGELVRSGTSPAAALIAWPTRVKKGVPRIFQCYE